MTRGAMALLAGAAMAMTAIAADQPARRVEAQSPTYRAVGVIDGDRMRIRLSRNEDNAPVSDAALKVTVRSVARAAIAQPDGSFQVRMPELIAPGEAVLYIDVTGARGSERLAGTIAAPQKSTDTDPSGRLRQLMWWVLNFGVCIGFLILISKRRKRAAGTGGD